MKKEIKFENSSEIKEFQEYDSNKSAIAKVCVLSTAPNSHGLVISEEVLRRDIGSIRGNFLVADMQYGDATTHTPTETPVGFFIPGEPIEFEEVQTPNGKVVKAWAYAVLSKQYAKSAYDMFVNDNYRATSIEMTVMTSEEDENTVLSFDAYGSTILGKTVAPSCKDAEISLVRFAQDATELFNKEKDKLSVLENFAKERRALMADEKYVDHPIDTSKEAIYRGEWDGNKAKQDLVKEKNFKILAPKVCLRLEEGWENREVTKLGYPVMTLHDGKWVYSTKGLSSALGYAKAEDETAVVKKIEKIYKTLDLDEDRKEDDAKMAEEAKKDEKFEIEGRKAWGTVIRKVKDHEGEGVYVDSIEKDHIIYTKGDVRYRVEAEVKVSPDDKTVDARIDWNTVKKDADQKMAQDCYDDCDDDDRHDDDCDKHDEDFAEMKAKCAKLEADVADRDNIIMNKDKKMGEMEAELEELRKFKEAADKEHMATSVESTMAEVKDCMSDEMFKELRTEGLNCKMAELDGWKNKVRAVAFENTKGKPKKFNTYGVWSFSAPIDTTVQKKSGLWD